MARLTTVPHDFRALTAAELEHWRAWGTVVDRRRHGRLALAARLAARAGRYETLLLDGSVGAAELYSDLLAATAASRRARVVISDATWKRGTNLLDRRAGAALVRMLDSARVTYCVLSSAELELFPRTWGVDPRRVVFTPFCLTFGEDDLAAPTSNDGGVFAGGDSVRDYAPLLEVAPTLGAPVTVATRTLGGVASQEPVSIGPVPHDEFNRLLRAATVVVVPLTAGLERSAGQQTYLNAMAIGKLVVVTDSPGARDYVEHGVTGLVVPPGDAAALADALRWSLDPAQADEQRAMRERAKEVARTRFGLSAYFERLREVAD